MKGVLWAASTENTELWFLIAEKRALLTDPGCSGDGGWGRRHEVGETTWAEALDQESDRLQTDLHAALGSSVFCVSV